MAKTSVTDISEAFLETIYILNYLMSRRIKFDLPANQIMILSVLDNRGALTTTELGEILNMSKQQVASTVNKMLDQLILLKKPVPQDKRSYQLVIADKGYQLLQQTRSRVTDYLSQEIVAQPDAKQAALLSAIRTFNHNLSDILQIEPKKSCSLEKKG